MYSPTSSAPTSSAGSPASTSLTSISTSAASAYQVYSSVSPRTPRTAPGISLSTPHRAQFALSPEITIRGSPRDESRRSRSSSTNSASHHYHRHRSPPRSPYDAKILYEHALQKAVTDTATVTDDIIARQSEILARKHDIAIWQRKIHAAENLINTLQGQVDVLVKEARNKQDAEKELTGQRDALMTNDALSDKEWSALTAVLSNLDIAKRGSHAS